MLTLMNCLILKTNNTYLIPVLLYNLESYQRDQDDDIILSRKVFFILFFIF